jgi:hypothetical protein
MDEAARQFCTALGERYAGVKIAATSIARMPDQ